MTEKHQVLYFELPEVPPLNTFFIFEEQCKLVENCIDALNIDQLRRLVRTMITDPCNQIDGDNFSHYFC